MEVEQVDRADQTAGAGNRSCPTLRPPLRSLETVTETLVKTWILLALVAVAACSRGPAPGATLPGAVTPTEAASEFMNAVKAQDLQAMAEVWGDQRGAARDNLERAELERRLLIMQGCYEHDRYQVLTEAPGPNGERVVRVQITRGTRTKTANFAMARGPSDRWYVRDADFDAIKEFCA